MRRKRGGDQREEDLHVEGKMERERLREDCTRRVETSAPTT